YGPTTFSPGGSNLSGCRTTRCSGRTFRVLYLLIFRGSNQLAKRSLLLTLANSECDLSVFTASNPLNPRIPPMTRIQVLVVAWGINPHREHPPLGALVEPPVEPPVPPFVAAGSTCMATGFESDRGGLPLSVAMKITVYVPVWLGLGVQLKILMKESKVAPCGNPDAVKMILSPGSGSVAFTVNVMMLPALTV